MSMKSDDVLHTNARTVMHKNIRTTYKLSSVDAIETACRDDAKRAALIKEYTKMEADLRLLLGSYSGIPSTNFFERILNEAKSDGSDRAIVNAENVYTSMLVAHKFVRSLRDLRKAANDAIKPRKASTQNLTTTGQALRAVSEAYGAAGTSLSARYQLAVAVAESNVQLQKQSMVSRQLYSRQKPRFRMPGPWGDFRVSVPFSPEDVKKEFSQPGGLPALGGYMQLLEAHVTKSVNNEGRIVKKSEVKSATGGGKRE